MEFDSDFLKKAFSTKAIFHQMTSPEIFGHALMRLQAFKKGNIINQFYKKLSMIVGEY